MPRPVYWLLAIALFVQGCAKEETAAPSSRGNAPAESSSESATPGDDSSESSSSASAETASSEKGKSAAPAMAENPLDLSYITEEHTSAIILHPARFLNSPLINALKEAGAPIDEQFEEMVMNVGFDLRQIEQVMILIDNDLASAAPMMIPGGPGGPGPGGPDERDLERIESKEFEKLEEEKVPDSDSRLDSRPKTLQPVSYLQPGDADGPDNHGGPGMQEPPFPTVVVRFTEAVDQKKLFENMPPLNEMEVDGMSVLAIPDPDVDGAFYFVNDKTLIAAPTKKLKAVASSKGVDSPLTTQLKSIDASNDLIVVADLAPVAPMLQQASGMLGFILPPQFAGLQSVPANLKSLALTMGVSGENLLQLQLTMNSAEEAKKTGEMFAKILDQAKQQFDMAREQMKTAPIPVPEEQREAMIAMADEVVAGLTSTVKAPTVTVTIKKPSNFIQIVEFARPAIFKAKAAADRAKRLNNLKMVGLAFHVYHDSMAGFPGAGSDFKGEKKGLSWRVHLLPYLDHRALYEQFHLDEPWDSEHNKNLIAQMPDVFKTKGVDEEGKTSLHVFVGEKAFSNDKGFGLVDVIDGASMTLLAVEAGADKADVWTKPGGLKIEGDDPIVILGTLSDGGFLAVMMDGSARFIDATISAETLKGLMTRNGGEVVDFEDF